MRACQSQACFYVFFKSINSYALIRHYKCPCHIRQISLLTFTMLVIQHTTTPVAIFKYTTNIPFPNTTLPSDYESYPMITQRFSKVLYSQESPSNTQYYSNFKRKIFQTFFHISNRIFSANGRLSKSIWFRQRPTFPNK